MSPASDRLTIVTILTFSLLPYFTLLSPLLFQHNNNFVNMADPSVVSICLAQSAR